MWLVVKLDTGRVCGSSMQDESMDTRGGRDRGSSMGNKCETSMRSVSAVSKLKRLGVDWN